MQTNSATWSCVQSLSDIIAPRVKYCETAFGLLCKNVIRTDETMNELEQVLFPRRKEKNASNDSIEQNAITEIKLAVRQAVDGIALVCKRTEILENLLDNLVDAKNKARIKYAANNPPESLLGPFEELVKELDSQFELEQEKSSQEVQQLEWRKVAELEAQRHMQFQQQMSKYKARALSQAQNAPLQPVIPYVPPERKSLSENKDILGQVLLDPEPKEAAALDDFYSAGDSNF